jgi:hypothetical protein
MHMFFDFGSAQATRVFAAVGSLIITVIIMATAIVPATPASAFTTGVLA